MILSIIQKKSIHLASILVPLLGAATAAQAADPFVVTASNNPTANQLLVYSPSGKLLQTLSTKGAGGATGNAGGVQTSNGLVAVVNFGSQSVSIFQVGHDGLSLTQVVPSVANPVSVAFGENHLYILGATRVESHAIFGDFVNTSPDGVSTLLVGDGSAAQVGVNLPTRSSSVKSPTSSRRSTCLRTERSAGIRRSSRASPLMPA